MKKNFQPVIDRLFNNSTFTFVGKESDENYEEKATYRLKVEQQNDFYCKVWIEILESNFRTSYSAEEIHDFIKEDDSFSFFPELGINIREKVKRTFKFILVDVYYTDENLLKFQTAGAWFDRAFAHNKDYKKSPSGSWMYAASEKNVLPTIVYVEDASSNPEQNNVFIERYHEGSEEINIAHLTDYEKVVEFIKKKVTPVCKRLTKL